jgi:hypothetical protein
MAVFYKIVKLPQVLHLAMLMVEQMLALQVEPMPTPKVRLMLMLRHKLMPMLKVMLMARMVTTTARVQQLSSELY